MSGNVDLNRELSCATVYAAGMASISFTFDIASIRVVVIYALAHRIIFKALSLFSHFFNNDSIELKGFIHLGSFLTAIPLAIKITGLSLGLLQAFSLIYHMVFLGAPLCFLANLLQNYCHNDLLKNFTFNLNEILKPILGEALIQKNICRPFLSSKT